MRPSFDSLIPELTLWNDGKGISLEDWIWIEGRANHALGFCSLLWPEFCELEGYFLRSPADIERLRSWEGTDASRKQIETAMNACLFEGIFPQDASEDAIQDKQVERLAEIMREMWAAKLLRDFPDRVFLVFILEGDDFGVTFHQVA